jgi:hypothetical protein
MAYRLSPEAEDDLKTSLSICSRKRETSTSLIECSNASASDLTCWRTIRS